MIPEYRTFIISHKRPHTVPHIEAIVGKCTWLVGDGELKDYEEYGATSVVETGKLIPSRNAALSYCEDENLFCVQISDDLQNLKYYKSVASEKAEPISFDFAVTRLIAQLRASDAYLGGVAPTTNRFFLSRVFSNDTFIVGDFIVVRPTPLRFDERMTLKEDYDYTLQHLVKYGRVFRDNMVMAEFKHRTNKGGAVDYRTSELEKENINYLKMKWGKLIVDNPKRKDEVLLKWRR